MIKECAERRRATLMQLLLLLAVVVVALLERRLEKKGRQLNPGAYPRFSFGRGHVGFRVAPQSADEGGHSLGTPRCQG